MRHTARVLVVAVHPSAELYGSDRMFLESVAAVDGTVLAVLPGPGPLEAALAERGVAHEVLPFPVLRKVALRSPAAAARFLLSFVRAVPALARWLRRQDADLVYVSTVIAPVWLCAARLARCRVVCHVHESEPGMSRPAARLLLLPLRLADVVIANSMDTRRWIDGSTSRRTRARTHLLYNGVPDPQPAPAPRALRAAGERAELVLVGRLSERKGQDVAVRALAALVDSGHDAALTLVGDCFPGYEHVVRGLERLVAELGLGDRVTFAGFTDPRPHLDRAHVALVPSRVEPFGLVAVEALMLGLPVVASDVGGLPEIITDGVTGRLVPPDDPAALAGALADLLADPAAAAELGRAGREDVRVRFSAVTYAERFRRVLHAAPLPERESPAGVPGG